MAFLGDRNRTFTSDGWGFTDDDIAQAVARAEKQHRHPLSARFHQILSELGALHDGKQADYGKSNDPFANVRSSDEWGVDGWVGAMIRLNDKVKRLQSFVRNGSLSNEGVDDSLRDIAVYSIIALCLFEEGR